MLVYLGRVPFDPLTESPSIPSSLGGRTPQAQDYWLVQVIGPVLFEWKAQLEGLGLKIINYVPDYTYIVKMDLDARAAVEDLGFVRWVGFYEPGYKIMEDLLDFEGQVPVTVGFFPDEPVGPALSRMGNLGRQPMEVYTGPFAGVIQAELGRDDIFAMAQETGVAWIEPHYPSVIGNDIARGIMNAATPWNTMGLYGGGQIVAVSDTGLDTGVTSTLVTDFAGRLVAGLATVAGSNWQDTNGHGTHVAGSVLGNGALSGSNPGTHDYTTSYAGAAPEARLVVQSVSNAAGNCCFPPANYNTMLQQAYDYGARIFTSSWGGPGNNSGLSATSYGRYESSASNIDQFLWNNQDMVVTWLVHNNGSDSNSDGVVDTNRLTNQSTAKNAISVGATESTRGTLGNWNYPVNPIKDDPRDNNANGMAAFSSRGPTTSQNRANFTTPVEFHADLAVSKTQTPAVAVPGMDVSYLIRVDNHGPSAATNVIVNDWIPADLLDAEWTCAGFGGATCPAEGDGDIHTEIDLPNGGWVEFTLTAVVDSLHPITNLVELVLPAAVQDSDTSNNSASATNTPFLIFLPLIVDDYTRLNAPDLVVDAIIATENEIQIVITNRGEQPALNAFWLDVYIDPFQAPSGVNETWTNLSSQGLVWGVPLTQWGPLMPGESLTLSVGDSFFFEEISSVDWPLAVGTLIYAQVDSFNANTTYGSVMETHEVYGTTYNNITGPVPVVGNALLRSPHSHPSRFLNHAGVFPIRPE